jgi:small-conductance mechanosensitive channel
MMQTSAGPPIMLGLTVVVLALIRTRSAGRRLLVEGVLLLALCGCFAAWTVSPLPSSADLAHRPDAFWLRALAVVWWLMAARVIASLSALLLGRDARSRQARLLSDLVAGAIYLTAGLVVLNSVLGLELKGLIATSGLIAVVLGLASQNTLADMFSGIAVGLDQPFHIGDRVSIGDFAEGVVAQMNWRSIRVQTDNADLAMIPNSLVAKSQIINRSVPTPRRAASVDIPVASPARSEQLLELLRQATLLCPALASDPAPSVTLKRLGLRSTTFSVSYFVATSADLATARSQVLRQARRLFRHAGLGDEAAPAPGALLSGLLLFETLSEDQIARLAAALASHRLDAGAALFAQGEVGTSIYIVRSGVLEVRRQEGAAARPFGRIGPGEYLGDISMMSGQPHPVSAAALTHCDVLELPRSSLEALLRDDRALGAAMEQSIRRSLDLLDRDDGARNAQPHEDGASLLDQIGAFLRRRFASPTSAEPRG